MASSPADAAPSPPQRGGLDLAGVRRLWPDVLERVKGMKRLTWTLLVHNAQVVSVDGQTLVLGLVNTGARDSFARGGSPEIVRQALIDVLGVDWRVEAVVDPSVAGGGPATTPAAQAPAPGPRTGEAVPARSAGPSEAALRARAAVGDVEVGRGPRDGDPGDGPRQVDDEVDADDPDADLGLSGKELLARELGAEVIEEYDER